MKNKVFEPFCFLELIITNNVLLNVLDNYVMPQMEYHAVVACDRPNT